MSKEISRLGVPNSGSRTDVGRVREQNEDNLIVSHPLYAVFDGMGGHEAGEVASEIAADVVSKRAPGEMDADALSQSVEEANLAIIRAAREGRGKVGMGTTCTAAMLSGERLLIAQVGDSRAYLLHDGELTQLTRDHSYVADLVEAGNITKDYARVHPLRSRITRALGTDPNMVADTYEINVEAGDRLLLCSDGLYSMITDHDIESIMCQEVDPQKCADKLVSEANEWGGHDNVTVIVVDVAGFTEIKKKRIAFKTKLLAAFVVVALMALVGGAIFAVNHFATTSMYLAENNGKVAIYQGYPEGNVGGNTDNLKSTSSVEIKDLDEALASRIRNGQVTCDSYEEAEKLIDEYKASVETKKKEAERQLQAEQESQNSQAEQSINDQSATGVQ